MPIESKSEAVHVPTNADDWTDRRLPKTLVLFDVDGTITPARKSILPTTLHLLTQLRKHCVIGFVGGSDYVKQLEQLHATNMHLFDYTFSENGLVAYRKGKQLAGQSFIGWLGEDKYKKLVNFILTYIADLDIPVKRGTFVEFRNGMINVSPIGRNCSHPEREEFEKYDKIHNIRSRFVEALKKNFAVKDGWNLTYSIGGMISFDVFPEGWDKTYCLRYLNLKEGGGGEFDAVHFFGDKCFEGGNDWEIFKDKRVIGHSVTDPDDTAKQITELFLQ